MLDITISHALAELVFCSIGDEVMLRNFDVDQITTTYCIFVDSALFKENRVHRVGLEYVGNFGTLISGKKEAYLHSNPSLRTFSTTNVFCLDKNHDVFKITCKTKYFTINPSTKLSCLQPFDILSIITKFTSTQETEELIDNELCSTRTYEKVLTRLHKFDSDTFAKKPSDVIDKRTIPVFKSSLAWSDIAGQHEVKNRLLECFSISEKVKPKIIS